MCLQMSRFARFLREEGADATLVKIWLMSLACARVWQRAQLALSLVLPQGRKCSTDLVSDLYLILGFATS